MNCTDTRILIPAYLDSELDLVRTLEVEHHLEGCAACRGLYDDQQTIRTAIRGAAPYFAAPAGLQRRVQASLRQAAAPPAPARPALRLAPALRMAPWRVFGGALALTCLLLVAWGVGRAGAGPGAGDLLAQDVIAGHVRSLQANHLADVVSTDQHTVKPWFDGKLDFSPPVADFKDQGFPLVGGRLDYLAGHPVAALVYGRRKHYVNLFVWPEAGAAGPTTTTEQGYNAVHWTDAGMTYWAVSDVTLADLQEFVHLVQTAPPPATP